MNSEEGFDTCKRWYRDYSGVYLDNVSVIFFGGDYGKDDTYITPLGALPGVIIQAHTYFSMSEHGWWARWGTWLAWIFDIILGFGVGLVFHWSWHRFHHYRQQDRFALQVIWASLNFIILIIIFALLVLMIAPLLVHGIWINPALIVIGLFIHSYISAVITAGKGDTHEADTIASPLYVLFGMPGHGVLAQVLLSNMAAVSTTGKADADSGHTPASSTSPLYALFGIPGHNVPGVGNLLFYGTLKIAVFWIAIGLAFYLLVTHH